MTRIISINYFSVMQKIPYSLLTAQTFQNKSNEY